MLIILGLTLKKSVNFEQQHEDKIFLSGELEKTIIMFLFGAYRIEVMTSFCPDQE